jgi:SAM-dependent methyltransferase
MLADHRLAPGSRVLDIGCGVGWTTLFLAEAGYQTLGIDLVEANVAVARERALAWNSDARFAVADMEELDLRDEGPFDAVLIFHSLHHVRRHRRALRQIARHLRPNGVLLLGEPTFLHNFSPNAHRVSRDRGWLERGFTALGLRRELRALGFEDIRQYHQGSKPYHGLGELMKQLIGLLASQVLTAPRHQIWLSARLAGWERSSSPIPEPGSRKVGC